MCEPMCGVYVCVPCVCVCVCVLTDVLATSEEVGDLDERRVQLASVGLQRVACVVLDHSSPESTHTHI